MLQPRPNPRRAFSLVELLVVVAIIAVLLGLLLPQLEKALEQSRLAACGETLHGIANALHTYAAENNGRFPIGPATPSLDPARPWNTLGSNLVHIAAANQFTGLGILTSTGQITDPRTLICPSDNDPAAKATIAATIDSTTTDAYSSYAFRQLDQTSSPLLLVPGKNAHGQDAIALVFDWQSDGPAPYTRHSHDENERLNIMFFDGHIEGLINDGSLNTTPTTFTTMPTSYTHTLDQLWLTADTH